MKWQAWPTTASVVVLLVGVSFAPAAVAGGRFDRIRQALGLESARVQPLELVQDEQGSIYFDFDVSDRITWTVKLTPCSLRADDYRLLIDDGVRWHRVPPPPPTTWRGTVLEEPSARVRATIAGDEVRALLTTSVGTWALQPVSDAGVRGAPGAHVIYASEAVIPVGHTTLVEKGGGAPTPPSPLVPFGTGLFVADLGIDADYEYYVLNGSDVASTVADVESIVNAVAGVFETRPIQIVYEITTLVVRTVPGTYAATNAGELRDEFAATWNDPPESSIQRDLAHLFTGKVLDNNIVGSSLVPGVCLPEHYALSRSRFSSNMVLRTVLTANGVGHNWSALSCNALPVCRIMCSLIGRCDGPDPLEFAPVPESQIIEWRDQVGCLTALPAPPALPFSEEWDGPDIDPSRWTYVKGAALSADAIDEPSPSLSLELDAEGAGMFQDDEIRSNVLQVSGVESAVLAYATQHRGVEAGEELIVEVLDRSLAWTEVARVTSDGVDQSTFVPHVHILSPGLAHDGFRIRFRTEVDEPDDDWYVDAISLREGSPVIDSIDPPAGSTAGGTPVTVLGSNFSSDAAVLFDGEPLPDVVFVSDAELQAVTVPHAAGPADVVVVQSEGEGTLKAGFRYRLARFIVESNSALMGAVDHPVAVLADHDGGLESYSFGVSFDDSVLTLGEVTGAGTDAEGADFFSVDLSGPDAWTLEVVIDAVGSGSIPAGLGSIVAIAEYDIAPGSPLGTTANMTLEDGLGNPPVAISLVQEGTAMVPETIDGVLTVSQKSPFIRGDADYNGVFNPLADGLYLLAYGFTNGPPPPCLDAADANDSGDLNTLTDALRILEHGFSGGAPPPPPYPEAGEDPTPDGLDCVP